MLFRSVNDDNKVKISAAGGVEAVLAAMVTHKGSAVVQEQACCALRNLAVNDDNKVKIAAAGGVEAILAAMMTHKGSAVVQEQACWALNNLAVELEID